MLDVHVMVVAPVDFPDSLVDVHEIPGIESPRPNVVIGFRGGEMWHAVSILAREKHMHIGDAFAGVLAAGLDVLGYACDPQVGAAIQTALERLAGG